MRNSRTIDRPSGFGLAFGAVNRSISGQIDDQIGTFPRDHGAYCRRFGEVGRLPIERDELERRGPSCAANLAADLPAGPKHQNPQQRLLRQHLVCSSKVRAKQLVEVVDGTGEAFFQGCLGTPTEYPLGFGDIGTALDRIVDRKRPASNL